MANQMIALQARAPQSNPLGAAVAQSTQMVNMMRQQDAAERQAMAAAQQAKIAAAQEMRAAAKEGRDIQEAKLKLLSDAGKIFRDSLASWVPFGDAAAAGRLRGLAVELVPELERVLPTAEKLSSDRAIYDQSYMTAEQLANKRYGTATTSTQVSPDGTQVLGVNVSGMPNASFAAPVPDISRRKPGVMPSMGAGAPAAPAMVTPDLDAAAQAVARGAGVNDPALRNLSQPDFLEVQKRASRIMQASPEFQGDLPPVQDGGQMQPASMGAPAQPDLGGIVQQMMQTGVVSQADFEAMRAAAPGKDAQLAELLRTNNIQIMPGGQQPEGMRNAVYRPDEGAPAMQQAQYNPNDYEPVRVKSPMQGPVPGSSLVPIPRVRDEAKAQRETPVEAAAKTTATERAKIAVDREKALPAKRQVTTIVKKIRDAYNALNMAEAIPSSKRGAGANVWDYMSVSGPGREIQRAFGTQTSKSLTDIISSRKLLATAIKNATGMSAQEMNSNVELQLMLDALTDPTQGYEAATSVLDTIEDLYGAPKPAAASTGGKKAVRTGVANGRRVVQYSDGTIDYAD